MLAAAKEEILSNFGDPCVFFPLAACEGVGEKPRLGFTRQNVALHRGSALPNSRAALRDSRSLARNTRRMSLLPQTPCSDLSLNNLDTFWNQNFATPQQVNSFFQGQPNAPGSWNGEYAAQQSINEGINPGLAVGIVGAETSFGNGPSLSATNIGNPFSCAIGRISNFNGSATCAAQTAFNDAFAGEGGTFLTPLSALVAGHYTTTQTAIWPANVDSWFRKFAKFIGKCN